MTNAADRSFGSIGDLVLTALRRYPERTALVCGTEEITYRDAESAVVRIVGLLRSYGVGPGDTVVQIRRNDPLQWLINAACYVAGFRSAALPMTGLDDADLLGRLGATDPAAVIVDRTLAAGLFESRSSDQDIHWWTDADVAGWRNLRHDLASPPVDLTSRSVTVGEVAPPSSLVRLAYTSGTSGGVRGVLLSSGALCAVATLTMAQLPWPDQPRVLCPEPVSGGFGNMVLPTLARGGTFVMLERFDAATLIDATRRHHPNILMMMPPALRALMSHRGVDDADWSSVELLCYSGAVLEPAEIDRAHELFGQVLCGIFGQVEVPKTIAMTTPADHASSDLRRRTSLGLPYPGMTLQIHDLAGRQLPTGVAGELCVRGPSAMDGYLDPAHDASAFRDGWVRTGDVCRIDEIGYLHYLNRLTDVFVVDHKFVCPADLEEEIANTTGLQSAVVKVGPMEAVLFAESAEAHDIPLPAAPIRFVDVVAVPVLPRNVMGRVDCGALRGMVSVG
ncbi:AMP-binding protein [Kribbella sp. NPDC004875]|uniref:AMP-binding protein n=1 Tax=Kribbella sp. NPDC004875 TaxID=3364107 RepID=UPI003689B9CE